MITHDNNPSIITVVIKVAINERKMIHDQKRNRNHFENNLLFLKKHKYNNNNNNNNSNGPVTIYTKKWQFFCSLHV